MMPGLKILLLTPPQPGLLRRRNQQPLVLPAVWPSATTGPATGLKRGLLPPLGVAYIAAVLERAGHAVRLLDAPALDLGFTDLVREALEFKPSWIGISAMSPTSLCAFRLARELKAALPDVPIILGGTHAICQPAQALNDCPAIDWAATGEAEATVVKLSARLSAGRPVAGVPGLAFRAAGGQVDLGAPAEPVLDLDALPFPARRHYPIRRYAPEPYENLRLPATNIIAARGCTWSRCAFCERAGPMKRPYRIQSPRRTLEEIRGLVADHGIRELVFYDDDLMSNARWIREFSELLLAERLDLVWSCRAIPNGSIRPDVLRLARRAGLWALFFGFESADQGLLDAVRKGIKVERSLQVARWCHELDIRIIGSFIIALPGETPELGRRTIEFAKKLDCDYAAFIPLHPFAGTPLHREALAQGRLIADSYGADMNATRYVPRATYVPDGYASREEVEAMVRRAYRRFYFRPSYFLKHVKRLRSFTDLKRYLEGLEFVINLTR